MIDPEDIKGRHRIEDVLTKRGVMLRNAAAGFTCKCPIHQEQSGSSFSVNVRKQLWFCHGKCGTGGDVFTLIQHLDGAQDWIEAAEILENRPLREGRMKEGEKWTPPPQREAPLEVLSPRTLPELPRLYLGHVRHFEQLAAQRKLSHWSGICLMQALGVLRFTVAYRHPAWAILDVENPCNAQVRRMDGKLWFERAKVMGITGNWAAWPVGLSVAERFPEMPLLLVEGTGDFVAAYDQVAATHLNAVPVAMFGASQKIHSGALPLMAGKKVLIVQQHDAAGERAATTWADQLRGAGCEVTTWQVPQEGADLNDHISSGQALPVWPQR
jgi:hypothetical protein